MKTVAVILVGLALTAAVAWDASERRYENCVDVAKTNYPLSTERDPNPYGASPRAEYGNFTGKPLRARRAAVERCSRLP